MLRADNRWVFLTRLARKWWVAPVLLPALCVEFHWITQNAGEPCEVVQLIDRLFPKPSDCVLRPYAYVDIWADGDARVLGEKWYLTTKPARTDQPVGQVTVRWGSHVAGFLAPCEEYDACFIDSAHPEPFLGIDVVSGVASAFEQWGHPLPPGVRQGLQPDGLTTASRFIWLGAAHDLVVVPLWVVALGAVGYRVAALGRWAMRRIAREWECPSCWYDLRGLPAGAPCPECGRALSKAA